MGSLAGRAASIATTVSPEVRVSVPARPGFVRVLRAVVASLGARLDLTYDRIDDLRIAVDEACAQLLSLDAATITMRLSAGDARLVVLVGADAAAPDAWPPPQVEDSLAWRVLSAVTDDLRFEMTEAGPTVRVEMQTG